MLKMLSIIFLLSVVYACNPPPVENIYRKEGRFPGGLNVPVAFISSEWAGKSRVRASGWLIDAGKGTLFSAKHFTDNFINNVIELGANKCKVFLSSRVYACVVVQVPPVRDAVVLKMLDSFNASELPKPYKISTTKLKVGDKVFIQGFHRHPAEITKSNTTDGFPDLIVPIMENFYELREADPSKQMEVVFDNLEAMVVDVNAHIKIGGHELDQMDILKFKINEYIKVITIRNHKFSFGGLSGGVAVRLNTQGVPEAVGIMTAEEAERSENNKKGELERKPVPGLVSDTIFLTPIESVKDLYDYVRQMR